MDAKKYYALRYNTHSRSYSDPIEDNDIINALINFREKHSDVSKDLPIPQWPKEEIYDSTLRYIFCEKEEIVNNSNGVKLLEYDIHGDLNREVYAILRPSKIIGFVCWLNPDMKEFLVYELRGKYNHRHSVFALIEKDDYIQLMSKENLLNLDPFPSIRKTSTINIQRQGIYEHEAEPIYKGDNYTPNSKLHERTWPKLEPS